MHKTKGKLSGVLHKGFKPDKCKTSLRMAVARIKLLRNRKEVQVRQMRREVAQLLEANQDMTARIRPLVRVDLNSSPVLDLMMVELGDRVAWTRPLELKPCGLELSTTLGVWLCNCTNWLQFGMNVNGRTPLDNP